MMQCLLLFFLLHLFAHCTHYGLYQRMKETERRGEVGMYEFCSWLFQKDGEGVGEVVKPMSKLTFLLSSLELIYLGPPCSPYSNRFKGMSLYRGSLETWRGNTASPSPSFITCWRAGLINNWGLILHIQRDSHYPKQ